MAKASVQIRAGERKRLRDGLRVLAHDEHDDVANHHNQLAQRVQQLDEGAAEMNIELRALGRLTLAEGPIRRVFRWIFRRPSRLEQFVTIKREIEAFERGKIAADQIAEGLSALGPPVAAALAGAERAEGEVA